MMVRKVVTLPVKARFGTRNRETSWNTPGLMPAGCHMPSRRPGVSGTTPTLRRFRPTLTSFGARLRVNCGIGAESHSSEHRIAEGGISLKSFQTLVP